jgi:diadenosine tetraphosphate (Ap4A) HIT family hydrolase
MTALPCELCAGPGGQLVHDDGQLRVIMVDEPDYPGFVRVVWNAHVREMTDLAADERAHLMQTVFAIERAQRAVLHPYKINVASLGNMTPHVHWHLVPRFEDDAHFPKPIWAERVRAADADALKRRQALVPALTRAIETALASADR